MNIRHYIPKALKYPIIALYILARTILRGQPIDQTKLNLAGVLPQHGSKKIVHGGKVKLLHLREHFGDTWKYFNIAYFVSSGLPFAPTIWIKIYKFFGVKIVWNQNGVAYGAWAGEKADNINDLMKPIHLADHVVYQTKFVKLCADKYLGKYHGPSSVLYNPVNTESYSPAKSKPEILTLLTMGSHFDRERVIIPIQVLKQLREKGINARLLIVGRMLWKDAEKDISREIQGLEKYTERRGAFLQTEAPAIYQTASILIHLKYLDPCPTVVLEALACGVPVVGSSSGGLPEMVNEKSGILIPIKEDFESLKYPSTDEVMNAIIKIQTNLDEYSLGAREQAIIKFNKNNWLKKHEEIFNELLK